MKQTAFFVLCRKTLPPICSAISLCIFPQGFVTFFEKDAYCEIDGETKTSATILYRRKRSMFGGCNTGGCGGNWYMLLLILMLCCNGNGNSVDICPYC